jgi:hypothetical protein
MNAFSLLSTVAELQFEDIFISRSVLGKNW